MLKDMTGPKLTYLRRMSTACVLAFLPAAIGLTTCFAADMPPYPQYEFSHVVLDLITTPFKDQEGRKRLADAGWPYAFGREWVNEGPYVDVIKVEGLIPNPLGRYYLYYSLHAHVGVCMAYADNLNGPWTTLDALLWDNGAAADVIWLEEEKKFAAYYHPNNHYSSMRLSTDGIQWSERQMLAEARDLYSGGWPCFFYTKVFKHTCPSLNNTYIMLWRAQTNYNVFNENKWNHATCLMYSDNGIDWTLHPEPIHQDGWPMGTDFMQWGDGYLLLNWGLEMCNTSYEVGGPYVLIWQTPADLATQLGTRSDAGNGKFICEKTMTLIEAGPGCGYSIDADSGRGPYEGQHIIEGDTLYHFGPAWNDSIPTHDAVTIEGNRTDGSYNAKKWACGQIGLWKAPVPNGLVAARDRALTASAVPHEQQGTVTRLVVGNGTSLMHGFAKNRPIAVYGPRGRLLGRLRTGADTGVLSGADPLQLGSGIRILRVSDPDYPVETR